MPRILNEVFTKPYRCQAAVTQFAVVVEGTVDGDVVLPGAADVGSIVGVALEAGATNEIIDVAMVPSYVICIAAAAIARGARVSISAITGTVKTAAPGAGINTSIVGQAMQAAAAAGDQISVLLTLGSAQG